MGNYFHVSPFTVASGTSHTGVCAMELGDQWLPVSAPHGPLSTLSGEQMNMLFLSPFHTNMMVYGIFGNKQFQQNFRVQSKTSKALIHTQEIIV